MLASDLNNPEFIGAHNPDSRLIVKFYSKPVQNEFESLRQQRPIFENVDFITIHTPGDKLNIIDTFAREEHKKRFPLQWASYVQRKEGDQAYIGTPVSEWPRITAAQAEELKALKFYTVESIANAADAQIQHIGMIAGQSAYAFRDDAKRFLMVADASAKLAAADEEVKKAKEAIEAEKAKNAAEIEEMRSQIKELIAAASSSIKESNRKKESQLAEDFFDENNDMPAPKKRGRKPKNKIEDSSSEELPKLEQE